MSDIFEPKRNYLKSLHCDQKAAYEQLKYTLDEVYRERLKRQIATLEQEIKELEEEISGILDEENILLGSNSATNSEQPTGKLEKVEPAKKKRKQKKNKWFEQQSDGIKVAIITGGFALIVAIITGFFQIIPNIVDTLSTTTIPTDSSILITETIVFEPTLVITPTQVYSQPTRIPSIGTERISQKDNATLMYVPEGEFTMGTDYSDNNDELPIHIVYLDAFWIDKYEVTNTQFTKFINQTNYQTQAEILGWSWIYNKNLQSTRVEWANWKQPSGQASDLEGLSQHPVVHVSWLDAMSYCEWAGRRLPTEAEWEKAARGSNDYIYPWGDNIDCAHAQYKPCFGSTVPVGSFPEGISPYGAMDLIGNVWEWVSDWYDENYYSISPLNNPTGPVFGLYRSLRGGTWYYGENTVRSSERNWGEQESTSNGGGFRCAISDNP